MKTWDSTRDALTEMIAAKGLTWDALAEETGVVKPSLHRFFHGGGGLNTASTDALLRYFGLVIIERPRQRPKRKGR